MTLRLRSAVLVALATAVLYPTPSHASGDWSGPVDELVLRGDTDTEHEDVLRGELGIVLPTWDAAPLYLAWRAIVTGGKGAPAAAHAASAAASTPAGWTDVAAQGDPASPFRSSGDGMNCRPDALVFAQGLLQSLKKRADATPARVQAWTDAQQRVFDLCNHDPLDVLGDADPLLAPPLPLPAAEPLYWRQLREYQLAAMAFYGAHYVQSEQAFARIGKSAGHPMQSWGAYLALRSHLRALQLPDPAAPKPEAGQPPRVAPEQVDDLKALRREGAAILADPALAARHEDTAATLRRAAYLLAPNFHFAELTDQLDDFKSDPFSDDILADWSFIGFAGYGAARAQPGTFEALRARRAWFDWLASMAPPTDGVEPPKKDAPPCGPSCEHVMKAWGESRAGSGPRRAWLLAALMSKAPLSRPMEQEARAVDAKAPEFLSVRYWLAARLLAAGRADEARPLTEDLVARLRKRGTPMPSALNLAIQQRFAEATSVADAAPWLLMRPLATTTPDTGESAPVPVTSMTTRPSLDGTLWLDRGLAVKDMLELARALKTPSPWRSRLAVAAWMRADLLGDAASAADASTLVEDFVPSLKPITTRYRALPGAPERHHALMMAALRHNLSPDILDGNPDADGTWPLQKPDDISAGMWCRIGADDVSEYFRSALDKSLPPLPAPVVSGDPARRDVERKQLFDLHSATGFIGLHAIDWAASHPADKDLPWLLHVAVASSRGGCVDADRSAISRKAWQVLHKRFPRSEWTAQTPYFY